MVVSWGLPCYFYAHKIVILMQVQELKTPLLVKAADTLLNKSKFESMRRELHSFREENGWVEDSALFYCLAELQVHCCGWISLAAVQTSTERHHEQASSFVLDQCHLLMVPDLVNHQGDKSIHFLGGCAAIVVMSTGRLARTLTSCPNQKFADLVLPLAGAGVSCMYFNHNIMC